MSRRELGSGIGVAFSFASPEALSDPAGATSVICSVNEKDVSVKGTAGPEHAKANPGVPTGPALQMLVEFTKSVFPASANALNAVVTPAS